MPNFDSFDGIKINIYNGDHLPPQIAVIGRRRRVDSSHSTESSDYFDCLHTKQKLPKVLKY